MASLNTTALVDFQRVAIVSMSLTMACALFGNTFLIVVILRGAKRKMLTSVQLLILHNCAADVLFALVTILPTCAELLMAPDYYGTDALCRVIAYLRLVPMYASPFLLLAISKDRYHVSCSRLRRGRAAPFRAICEPWLNLRQGAQERSRRYAGFCWFLSLLFSTPNLAIYSLNTSNDGMLKCMAAFNSRLQTQLYVCYFSTVVWLIPSAASAYFYFRVCHCVWHELTGVKKSISFQEVRKDSADRIGLDGSADARSRPRGRLSSTCLQQIKEVDRQRIHTVKMTMTIVLCNFLLWAPFCVVNLLFVFDSTALPARVTTLIMLVGNLNSCVNPWIYMMFQWHHVKTALFGAHVVIGARNYSHLVSERPATTAEQLPAAAQRNPAVAAKVSASSAASVRQQFRFARTVRNAL